MMRQIRWKGKSLADRPCDGEGQSVQGNRNLRTGCLPVSPGISREVLERPLSALKGHSGVLACGGVSHKADDIPTPPPKPP